MGRNVGYVSICAPRSDVLQAYKRGITCHCGNPIWFIGSAITERYSCFTCITEESDPDGDYEFDEAC